MRTLPLLLVCALCCALCAAGDGSWHQGRATFYGTDAWSIHTGSCGFGYIFQDEPLGWDTTAICDSSSQLEFSGSCGRCYEVRCKPSSFADGYGSQLDRAAACYDPTTSVVVRVTDACPCHYPGNYYSNKRWCCGDTPHFDMSIWAYEKLASTKWGVIGVEYRVVPCDFQPAKPAPALSNPTPGQPPPPGAVNPMWPPSKSSVPSRKWSSQQADQAYQPFTTAADLLAARAAAGATAAASSASASAVASASTATAAASAFSSGAASASASASSAASLTSIALPAWPSNQEPVEAGPGPSQPGMQSDGWVYKDALQNGWWDRSWLAKVDWGPGRFGAAGGTPVCAELYWGGALSVGHGPGFFQGARSIEFWVKTDGGTPDVEINIGSAQVGCKPQQLKALPRLASQGSWSKFAFSLGQFGSSYDRFSGCGGAGAWDASWLEFRNSFAGQQGICVDQVRLLA